MGRILSVFRRGLLLVVTLCGKSRENIAVIFILHAPQRHVNRLRRTGFGAFIA